MFGTHAAFIPGPSTQHAGPTVPPPPTSLGGFTANMRVIYIPGHANGDRGHPDCEHGRVSSVNDKYVFVRFDEQVRLLGWYQATGKACYPSDLVAEMMSDL